MPVRPPVHKPPQGDSRATVRLYDQHRGNSTERGYDGAWRRFRAAFLRANPLCADCYSTGEVIAAAEVHHLVKLRDAPGRRLDPTNCRALCQPCHSARTARGE